MNAEAKPLIARPRFFLHHAKELEPAFTRQVIKAIVPRIQTIRPLTGPIYYDDSSVEWAEQVERWREAAMEHGGFSIQYPIRKAPLPHGSNTSTHCGASV
jgi:hypothetical protein